jgi:hypothetical protein
VSPPERESRQPLPVTSFHTRGRALDLVPRVFAVKVNGAPRTIVGAELHSQLYPALRKAAATHGSAITEDGAQPVPEGCCGCIIAVKDKKGNMVDKSFCEDHVHVQWQ